MLRFTGKGLNVRKVSLALSRLARLAYELFTKPSVMFIHGRDLPYGAGAGTINRRRVGHRADYCSGGF